MVRVEVLYSEYMNLYGDNGNIKYLKQCLPKSVEFIYTDLNDKPKFMTHKINMLYLGPCTEEHQLEIIEKLKPYKEKIKKLINDGVVILAIGNALEIFGKYIEKTDGKTVKALGIFNVYTKRVKDYRYNELCLGVTNDGFEIVGYKNQMSHLYGKDGKYFQDMFLGTGRNPETRLEGIMENNFIGTYILGPILPLNPYFTESLLIKMGIKSPKLAFKETAIKAYEVRLNEYRKLIKNK
ncbi:MAG: hypothetical protein PHY26_03095 [Bacilli bacterium]|nr:hypothetical protein [Bacilli bacterium]